MINKFVSRAVMVFRSQRSALRWIPYFSAGMLLAVPAYYFGRQIWKLQSETRMTAGSFTNGAAAGAAAPYLPC